MPRWSHENDTSHYRDTELGEFINFNLSINIISSCHEWSWGENSQETELCDYLNTSREYGTHKSRFFSGHQVQSYIPYPFLHYTRKSIFYYFLYLSNLSLRVWLTRKVSIFARFQSVSRYSVVVYASGGNRLAQMTLFPKLLFETK